MKAVALGAVVLFVTTSLLYVAKRQWENSLEAGYVAFNAGSYSEARDRLSFLAEIGDAQAQQLMGYMAGLGLGGHVDFADALRWMRKSAPSGVDARIAIGEQAYYLGRDAIEGRYGANREEIGRLWLHISELSGSELAKQLLEQEKQKEQIGTRPLPQ